MRPTAGGSLDVQQRHPIARVLAAVPKMLILEEPTEGILSSIIADIDRVKRMPAERGMNGGREMAVEPGEQSYDLAAELAYQYIVMRRGANMEAEGVRAQMSI